MFFMVTSLDLTSQEGILKKLTEGVPAPLLHWLREVVEVALVLVVVVVVVAKVREACCSWSPPGRAQRNSPPTRMSRPKAEQKRYVYASVQRGKDMSVFILPRYFDVKRRAYI